MANVSVVPISLGFVKAFLVRGEKDILVDAGIAGSGRKILAVLARRGIDPHMLSLVLVTHGHRDHWGGVRELLPAISCPIAINARDAEALRSGINPPSQPVGALMRLLFRGTRAAGTPTLPPLEPGIAFEGTLDLNGYGIDGIVEPTPGHTHGSVSIFLANSEAIIGDLLRGSFLASGAPRWPFLADDLAEVRRSVSRVLDRKPVRIWTSHGGPLTPDAVREFLRRTA